MLNVYATCSHCSHILSLFRLAQLNSMTVMHKFAQAQELYIAYAVVERPAGSLTLISFNQKETRCLLQSSCLRSAGRMFKLLQQKGIFANQHKASFSLAESGSLAFIKNFYNTWKRRRSPFRSSQAFSISMLWRRKKLLKEWFCLPGDLGTATSWVWTIHQNQKSTLTVIYCCCQMTRPYFPKLKKFFSPVDSHVILLLQWFENICCLLTSENKRLFWAQVKKKEIVKNVL